MITNTEVIWIKAGLTKSGKMIHLTSSYSNNQPDCARNGMNTNKRVVYKLASMNTTIPNEWKDRILLSEQLKAEGHVNNFCAVCFKVGA
jgi:hypothetical protein